MEKMRKELFGGYKHSDVCARFDELSKEFSEQKEIFQHQIDTLNEQNRILSENNVELQLNANEYDDNISQLKAEISDFEAKLLDYQNQVSELQQKIMDTENMFLESEEKVESLSDEILKLRDINSNLSKENELFSNKEDEISRNKDQFQEEIDALHGEIVGLNAEAFNKDAEISALKELNQEYFDKLSKLKKSNETLDLENLSLKTEIEKLKNQISYSAEQRKVQQKNTQNISENRTPDFYNKLLSKMRGADLQKKKNSDVDLRIKCLVSALVRSEKENMELRRSSTANSVADKEILNLIDQYLDYEN